MFYSFYFMCILYHSTNLAIFKNSIDCVPSMKKNLQSGWGEPGSLHERKNLQSGWGKPGSPEDTAYGWTCPSRAGRGTTFPRTPLSTASWMQRPRKKHPCLAASATWWSSCKSGKAHHTKYRLLRALENKCQSHRSMILSGYRILFIKKPFKI